jgi:ankyrin repeat protein
MELVASGGNGLEAKLEAFQVLCYQLSNKLIEDPSYYDDEDYDENSDKYAQTVRMFRDLDLPPDLWTEIFIEQKTRTGAAAAEALFEAAINEGDLEIIMTLLKSGVVDPDVPVWTCDGMQYPIQWAASRIERRGHSNVIKLLVELGADVNKWTQEYGNSALLDAARSGSFEIVRLLVEHGADFRDLLDNKTDYIGMDTPLIAVIYNKVPPVNDSGCSGPRGGNNTEGQELESVGIFRYLLSLHGDTKKDRDIIQEALIAAAALGRTDLIPLALDAGAELQTPGRNGFTALQAASGSYGDKSAVIRQLLTLGARPKKTGILSELHLAAFKSSPNTIRALIEHGMDVNMWIPGLKERQLNFLGRYLLSEQKKEFFKIAHLLHTPLDFALAAATCVLEKDRELNAVVLLRAGARLTGGELVRAIKFNNDELLNCILEQETDINQAWCGLTALQACLDSGALEMAEKLIRRGARLNGGEVSAAFEKGTPEFISTLLSYRGGLNGKDELAPSPLERACSKQNWPVIEWALQKGLVDYSPGALCAAVCLSRHKSERRLEQIKLLLHHRKRVLHHYNPIWSLLEGTAAGYAALCGEEDILDVLLLLGDLEKCIIPMYPTSLVVLLSWEYDWVTEQYSKLDWTKPGQPTVSILVPAILSRCWDNVERLLNKGCKADGFSLLATIRFFDNDQVIQLLSSGARADTRLKDFDSPLQLAARLGRLDVVRTLLHHGANVNDPPAQTKTHWSLPRAALQAATETGNQELIDLLLEAGADVNGPPAPDGGATALQLAAIKGYLPIAQRLLDAGAQIDATRARVAGRTALEGAAEHGRLDMVQFLLENGALTFDDGACQYHRAMGFARKNGHRAVLQLLEHWDEGDMDSFWCNWDGLLDDDFQEEDADGYDSE